VHDSDRRRPLSSLAAIGIIALFVAAGSLGGILLARATADLPAASAAVIAGVATPSPVITAAPAATSQPAATEKPAATPTPRPVATPTPSPRPAVAPTSASVALNYANPSVGGAADVNFFGARGSTAHNLIVSVTSAARAHCPGDDTLGCVHLDWRASWKNVTTGGVCTIASVEMTHRDVVWLPRWKSPARVDPKLLVWWKAVIKHIAWHEGRHIAVEVAFLPKVKAALKGAPCDDGHAIVAAYSKKGSALQDAFDAQDADDWSLPPFPLR
jgi:predicted secreted Zn-dependent protease